MIAIALLACLWEDPKPVATTNEVVRSLVVAEPELALRKTFLAGGEQGTTLFVGRAGHGLVADGEARWIEALVDEVDAVCIDVGFSDGEALERWVHTGEGTLSQLLDEAAPWAWDQVGAERVLRALRERCERTPQSLPRLVGVGIGSPKREYLRAQAFVEEADFNLGHRTGIVLGPLRQEDPDGRTRWYQLDAAERYVMRVAIGEAYNVLSDQREQYAETLGAKKTELGIQSMLALSNVERSLSWSIEPSEMDPHGDMLAGMVAWTRSHLPPAAKVVCLVLGRDALRGSDAHSAAACLERTTGAKVSTLLVVGTHLTVRAADASVTGVQPRTLELKLAQTQGFLSDLQAALPEPALLDVRALAAVEVSGEGRKALAQRWSEPHTVLLAARSMGSDAEAAVEMRPVKDADFVYWVPTQPKPPVKR